MFLVELAGLEPAPHGLKICCSGLLSYKTFCCAGRTRTADLLVMSQASYRCSTALLFKSIFFTFSAYNIYSYNCLAFRASNLNRRTTLAFEPEKHPATFMPVRMIMGAPDFDVVIVRCFRRYFNCVKVHIGILSLAKLSLFSNISKYFSDKIMLFYRK